MEDKHTVVYFNYNLEEYICIQKVKIKKEDYFPGILKVFKNSEEFHQLNLCLTPLYHGTDSAIRSLSKEERTKLFQNAKETCSEPDSLVQYER